MSLKGKTAVITGSNSGIGLGIAREMAKAGADVVLNSFTDRDEDHALAAEISSSFRVNARYIAADMSKADDCRALIEKAGGRTLDITLMFEVPRLGGNCLIEEVADVARLQGRRGLLELRRIATWHGSVSERLPAQLQRLASIHYVSGDES